MKKVVLFLALMLATLLVVIAYIMFTHAQGENTWMSNIAFFIIVLLSVIAIICIRHRQYIGLFLRSVGLDEKLQSVALLEAMNAMVSKLDHRDHVLIQEKEQAEYASKAKSDFLVSMSHELRTPMHAILNFADIGKKQALNSGSDKIMLYFSRIEESGERLLRLINSLLDLTKLESGKVSFRFDNNDIIECVHAVKNEMTAILEKKAIKVNIQNKSGNTKAVFDKDNIIRVMVNLLSNAIKFSPDKSTINIIIEHGQFAINNKAKVKGLKVSFEDQGTGIPEDEREIIFNKFIQGSTQSDKEKGSGLGLAICKEVVQAHKGSIWAENREGGVGARMSFVIPER